MKCSECGGTYVRLRGDLDLIDKFAGPIRVHAADYMRCDQCDGFLFSPIVSRKIERARHEKLQQILLAQPIGAFVNATETANTLRITRQALNKHRRISRGFIFQTRFGGRTVYLRKSVEQFARTGDGRFPLWESNGRDRLYSPEVETWFHPTLYGQRQAVSEGLSGSPFERSVSTSHPRRPDYAR